MSRPRSHRLPQRLDYTLIPAPLDLQLEDVSEKSPLPAIIVTPCSPSSSHYSIAFLAPPPKPSLWERSKSYLQNLFPLRTRTLFVLMFLFFVLSCHYLVQRLTVSGAHLDFFPIGDGPGPHGPRVHDTDSWFDFGALLRVVHSRMNSNPSGDLESSS